MTEPTLIDEAVSALVRDAQAGDSEAFERLVRRYYERIYRWALARTGDRDDADDVTQEVLLRLHRHLSRFDGRSRFTTWLYQVTRSAAGDLYRRRTRRERLFRRAREQMVARAHDPRVENPSLDEKRAAGLVRTFLQELSERQREILDLVDLQGLSTVEVAERLELEPVTVRSHLFRARRTIREMILESHPELMEGYRY